LNRLHFEIGTDGGLTHPGTDGAAGDAPGGLLAAHLSLEEMLPCVGQAAIGIEIRSGDTAAAEVCRRLNHAATWQCVAAERAFLRAMGGGCQLAVAACAETQGAELRMRVVSFLEGAPKRAEGRRPVGECVQLGEELAARLRPDRPARING
jgi:hydroxymethylbilane synthase